MSSFYKVAEGLDVSGVVSELAVKRDLWGKNPIRTISEESPHYHVDDILLFFNKETDDSIVDSIQTYACNPWFELNETRAIALRLLNYVCGTQLGRVILTRLPSGKKIKKHKDVGSPVDFYTRFQVVIKNKNGCLFKIEDESKQFTPGEVWTVDNSREHEVVNFSGEDRIVLICDIKIPRLSDV